MGKKQRSGGRFRGRQNNNSGGQGGGQGGGYQGNRHHKLAAAVEFIHTATLLHDDVVDASTLRRGRATANETFGNPASVLVGDFLHTRSFQMMVETGSMRVMEILSEATNIIAEGETTSISRLVRSQ